MPVMQLIYVSQPFGFDDLALTSILASALRNNVRDNITGALICREDLFMQLLEGPEAEVKACYARIVKDNRHCDVRSLWSGNADHRLFPEWAMRHDPAHSWMWTREEVSAGAVDTATGEEARAIFARLAASPPVTAQRCPMARHA